ncbi:hypothetical protein MMC25_003135 [Agyrium rufum]|nr:hypothetical protein [Agyrium rufum]
MAAQAANPYKLFARQTVHVKIFPRPRNITESQHVLRLLERYGPVFYYRHLQHEPNRPAPNTVLAIYRNLEDAQKLIRANPIRFRAGRPDLQLSEYGHASGVADSNPQPSSFDDEQANFDTSDVYGMTSSSPTIPSTEKSTDAADHEILLKISASEIDHEAFIRRQPYYGQWRMAQSVITDDLAQRVPVKGFAEVSFAKPEKELRLRLLDEKRRRGHWLPRLGLLREQAIEKKKQRLDAQDEQATPI